MKLRLLINILVIVFFCLTGACLLSANSNATQADGSIKGLTLSPLRSELEIAPGTSLEGRLTITNSTDKPMVVNLNAEEFSVTDQQYDYAFTEESDTTKWVVFNLPQDVLLPGEEKQVLYHIAVPLSAEPSGRYLSLFATTDTSTTGGGVNSMQRVGSLLYITVTGNVTRDGHLISLKAPWAICGESQWSVVLQNTGTTHFRSGYSMQVQKIWGGVVADLKGDALILPGTVRLITDKLPLPQLPGIYKVVYNIGLGDQPAVTEIHWIVYVPLWAIAILLVIVASLVFGFLWKKLSKR